MFTELKMRVINELKCAFYTDEAFLAEPHCLFGRWYTSNGTYAGSTFAAAQRKEFLETLA